MPPLSKRLLIVLGIYGVFSLSLCAAWSSAFVGWRIRSGTLVLQSSSSSSHLGANNDASDRPDAADEQHCHQQQPLAFQILKCQYADLNPVSDIIMDSFYDTKTSWRRLLKLAELNRLQQNFPYVDTDLHQMFVAVVSSPSGADDTTGTATTSKTLARTVIGFVDIDARPCRPEIKLPRPYLSDLAVHPQYRRKGVAKALIQACEDFCREIPRKELYIRVEETNHAAVAMYMTNLNYQSQGVEVTKEKKRVLTLHKLLRNDEPSKIADGSNEADSSSDQQATVQGDDQEFVI